MTDLNRLEKLKSLSEAKRELLLRSLREKSAADNRGRAIPRLQARDGGPLSYSQQRIWVLDQLEPGNPAFNISRSIRIEGPLNIEALRQALKAIVWRHETLRTVFTIMNGAPRQVVTPRADLEFQVIDLSTLLNDRQEMIRMLAAREASRPFDLSRGPLLRTSILRLNPREHVLLITIHHIVSDATSNVTLIKEVSAVYGAFSTGRPSPLKELPIQYLDFAVWQRGRLQTWEKHLTYWKDRLAGRLEPFDLPADRPLPEVETYKGKHLSHHLPADLVDALDQLSRAEGVTLFTTFLGAFSSLLYLYTGQEDIIVGSPVEGRNSSQTEEIIGPFINLLPLRTNLTGNPTFREVLARTHETMLGAYEHQELPFDKIVAELNLARKRGGAAITRVGIDFHSQQMPSLRLEGLEATSLEIETGFATADLILYLSRSEGASKCIFEYSTDLFDEQSIVSMSNDFRLLLETVIAESEIRLQDLSGQLGKTRLSIWSGAGRSENGGFAESETGLTKYQLLIWAGQKMNPQLPLYINPFNTFIKGCVDPAHFREAFAVLVNSSDALRTVITEEAGKPRSHVLAEFSYELEFMDLSGRPDPRAALDSWVRERLRRPFDFSRLLFDSALIKLQPEEYVWYFNPHHTICDAWAYGVAFTRLEQFYRASLEGKLQRKVHLPQFADYIEYEAGSRSRSGYSESEAYWEAKFASPYEPTRFFGRSYTMRTTSARRASVDLGFQRSERITQMAHEDRFFQSSVAASLSNIFAGFLCIYLFRISGSYRISLGWPYHNRRTKDFKETVGMFMQILPLRIYLEEADTFCSVVRKVAAESVQSLRRHNYIVGNRRSNLYDVEFNFITATFPRFEGRPVEVDWLHPGNRNEALALQVHDLSGTGSFKIEFDLHNDVFTAAQGSQFIDQLLSLIDSLLADPLCSINNSNLLLRTSQKSRLLDLSRKADFDFV